MKHIISISIFCFLLLACSENNNIEQNDATHQTTDSLKNNSQKEIEEEMEAIHDVINIL